METTSSPRSHRLMAVSVIVQHLREAERPDAGESVFSFLELRRLLHRQPWRQPAYSSVSVMEMVHRFQAFNRAH